MRVIELQNLTRIFRTRKSFLGTKKREIKAIDNISLSVVRGELFGLLGPNGAGKTTTIKILTTLLLPTSGQAKVLGLDVAKSPNAIREKINFVFGGERGLYWRLTGRDNLQYFSDLYRIPRNISRKRIEHVLGLVGLSSNGDQRVETYSKGMKQRLHIAKSLLNDPEVIFLDEPTIGIDPVGAKELHKIIQNLVSLNKTIFLTTHYMFEADKLCGRVAVIKGGRIVADDKPYNLKERVRDVNIIDIETYGITEDIMIRLRSHPAISFVSMKENDQKQLIQIQTLYPKIIKDIVHVLRDFQIERITTRGPTLEDAYIRLIGGSE